LVLTARTTIAMWRRDSYACEATRENIVLLEDFEKLDYLSLLSKSCVSTQRDLRIWIHTTYDEREDVLKVLWVAEFENETGTERERNKNEPDIGNK